MSQTYQENPLVLERQFVHKHKIQISQFSQHFFNKYTILYNIICMHSIQYAHVSNIILLFTSLSFTTLLLQFHRQNDPLRLQWAVN